MQITAYQIVQFILIGIILVYLIYYVYTILFDKKYQPKAWQDAVKKGHVSKRLQKLEKNYPDKVIIEEQGLRDGLQNENGIYPVEKKLEVIDALVAAGATRLGCSVSVDLFEE